MITRTVIDSMGYAWGPSVTPDQALADAIKVADPNHWAWVESLPVAYQSAPAVRLEPDVLGEE